jgi:hypothetical protein
VIAKGSAQSPGFLQEMPYCKKPLPYPPFLPDVIFRSGYPSLPVGKVFLKDGGMQDYNKLLHLSFIESP